MLITAAMLDDILAGCLRNFLVEHLDTERMVEGLNAPFGRLSARILGAFAMGLLSEREYAECETIRKIRNEFAHNVHSSFTTQRIADLCKNLTFAARGSEGTMLDSKATFLTAGASLISHLLNRAAYVGQKRLKYGDWKF